MVVMNSPKTYTSKILQSVTSLAPSVSFHSGSSFYWSPKNQTVSYNPNVLDQPEGAWALLHETAHALLGHTIYKTDFELLSMEVTAWDHAKHLSSDLGISIDENYIQDCLDTYRDWLHRRSTCPTCGSVGLQHSESEYRCHNCNGAWQVSTARFCRPYRRKKTSNKEKSPGFTKNQTTFQ
jgi:hypothetical protein